MVFYIVGQNKIECFSNADLAGSKEDGRST